MKKFSCFIITASVAFALPSCKPKYDVTSPKVAPVTEAVFASGSIEPKDAYIITSLSDGFIVKSFVTENDIVQDNQILFRLDNRQQNTQVDIARNNLNYARISASNQSPALLQIKAQVNAARVKKEADSVTLGRMERLYTTHSVSKQDVDNARLAYESDVENYTAAVESLRVTTDKVSQDLRNTASQLQNVETGNQYFNLTAIGSGKVYQIFRKNGDLVRKGDQVAQIGNPDSIVINLNIDEGNIGKVALGMKVLVELNTQTNKTYEAVVSKIYPHFDQTAQAYKVEARFVANVPGLIAGTQLQANIITGTKEKAMVIPHIFVMPGNKVLVQRDSKIDTVAVTLGITSDDQVEVLSGLKETDQIAKLKNH